MYKRNKNILAAAYSLVISMGATSGGVLAGGFLDVESIDADFSDALNINNPYWPLSPDLLSRTFTYIGETEDECVIDQLSVRDNFHCSTYLVTAHA